jgi:hypothetical protein
MPNATCNVQLCCKRCDRICENLLGERSGLRIIWINLGCGRVVAAVHDVVRARETVARAATTGIVITMIITFSLALVIGQIVKRASESTVRYFPPKSMLDRCRGTRVYHADNRPVGAARKTWDEGGMNKSQSYPIYNRSVAAGYCKSVE